MEKRIRITVFKLTQSEWWPSYKLGEWHEGKKDAPLVKVTLLQFYDKSGWRVCAWGADDLGLERDYKPEEEKEAEKMFYQVISQEYVNIGWLRDQGFINA